MQSRIRFKNLRDDDLIIRLEPDGWNIPIPAGKVAEISYLCKETPPTINLWKELPDDDDAHLDIWPGDGKVTVRIDGVNPLSKLDNRKG